MGIITGRRRKESVADLSIAVLRFALSVARTLCPCLTVVDKVKIQFFKSKIACLGSKNSIPNIPDALVGSVQTRNVWLKEGFPI